MRKLRVFRSVLVALATACGSPSCSTDGGARGPAASDEPDAGPRGGAGGGAGGRGAGGGGAGGGVGGIGGGGGTGGGRGDARPPDPDAAGGGDAAGGPAGDAARDGGPTAAGPDARRAGDAPAGAASDGTPYVFVSCGFYSVGPVISYRLDAMTGRLTEVDRQGGIESATFAFVHPNRRVLYLNFERGNSGAAAYAIDGVTGKLRKLNEVLTGQAGAAHSSIDPLGRFVLQANYEAGSVSVIEVREDGSLGRVVGTWRTDDPYPHSVRADPAGKFVFAPNRGNVRVGQGSISQFVLAADGKLSANTPAKVPAPNNTGPRHLEWHPSGRWAYVNSETDGSLAVFAYDAAAGTLREIQRTAPASGTPADLRMHPSGGFLYVMYRSRGIVLFTIDAATGRATMGGQQPTGGGRNFAIDATGRWLALPTGGDIVIFGIDPRTGALARADARPADRNCVGVDVAYVPGPAARP